MLFRSSLAVQLSGVVAMGWLLTSLSFFTCLKNEDDIAHLIGPRAEFLGPPLGGMGGALAGGKACV